MGGNSRLPVLDKKKYTLKSDYKNTLPASLNTIDTLTHNINHALERLEAINACIEDRPDTISLHQPEIEKITGDLKDNLTSLSHEMKGAEKTRFHGVLPKEPNLLETHPDIQKFRNAANALYRNVVNAKGFLRNTLDIAEKLEHNNTAASILETPLKVTFFERIDDPKQAGKWKMVQKELTRKIKQEDGTEKEESVEPSSIELIQLLKDFTTKTGIAPKFTKKTPGETIFVWKSIEDRDKWLNSLGDTYVAKREAIIKLNVSPQHAQSPAPNSTQQETTASQQPPQSEPTPTTTVPNHNPNDNDAQPSQQTPQSDETNVPNHNLNDNDEQPTTNTTQQAASQPTNTTGQTGQSDGNVAPQNNQQQENDNTKNSNAGPSLFSNSNATATTDQPQQNWRKEDRPIQPENADTLQQQDVPPITQTSAP